MKPQVYQDLYDFELTHWWYRVRRSLAKYFVSQEVRNKKDVHILDIGCGTGALMKELSKYGRVTGVDFADDAIAFCKKRGLENVQKGNISELPFKNNTFDVVLALDILEHVKDDVQASQEILRVLKPNGTAIVFVPAFMMLWGSTDEVSQHERRYRKQSITNTLTKAGLDVKRATYFNFLLFTPILLTRLLARLLERSIINEYRSSAGVVNSILYMIFNIETMLLRHMNFPFGVSVMVICEKKAHE